MNKIMSVKTIKFNIDAIQSQSKLQSQSQSQSQSVTKKNKKHKVHSTTNPLQHYPSQINKHPTSYINSNDKVDSSIGLKINTIANKNAESVSEIDSSISYLKKITRDYKKQIDDSYESIVDYNTPIELNVSLPKELNPNVNSINPNVNSINPNFSIQLKQTPKYGILKNSTLPTLRTWTRKNSTSISSTSPDNIESSSSKITFGSLSDNNPPLNIPVLQIKSDELLTKTCIDNNDLANIGAIGAIGENSEHIQDTKINDTMQNVKNIDYNTNEIPIKPQVKSRTNNTRKNLFGKHKNGKVSVLIKNNTTRKRILAEQSVLHSTKINVMKRYLIKRHLLKIGTWAPDNIIQSLYEQSILSGNVENKAKEVLLHNFFTNTSETI